MNCTEDENCECEDCIQWRFECEDAVKDREFDEKVALGYL